MRKDDSYKYKLDELVITANKASNIINNQLYKNAWELMNVALYDSFTECDPRDVDELQRIRMMLSAASSFRGHFESLITSGKMARLELQEIEDEAKDETLN